MKYLIPAIFSLCLFAPCSVSMAESTNQYSYWIPPMGDGIGVADCLTVQELGLEFKNYVRMKDTSNGFNTYGVRALAKDVYLLTGFYEVKKKGKEGRLFLVADASQSIATTVGSLLNGIQNSLSSGSLEVFARQGSSSQVEIACTYKLTMAETPSESFVLYARPK